MAGESEETQRKGQQTLRWQSQAVLLALVPVIAIWVTLAAGQAWQIAHGPVLEAAAISLGFATIVFVLRAATAGGALTGGLITAALYLQAPGLHTALWPLSALVVLTYAATRFGRKRKEALGTAEGRHGRRASQVAANLGVAALAGIPLREALGFGPIIFQSRAALVAMVAAMAEATADTLSSEIGQVLGAVPRLVITFGRVPAGTDGAVSAVGSIAGCAGAAAVTAVAAWALPLSRGEGLIAFAAGLAGLFIDSLLGAIPERRGWLNNDAVNALSTVAAAVLAAYACRWFRIDLPSLL